jgi:hypothetical protein
MLGTHGYPRAIAGGGKQHGTTHKWVAEKG